MYVSVLCSSFFSLSPVLFLIPFCARSRSLSLSLSGLVWSGLVWSGLVCLSFSLFLFVHFYSDGKRELACNS